MRANGYKCYQTKCGCCIGNVCAEPFDIALGCSSRLVKSPTNADRIRAMSDEELARTFAQTGNCPPSPKYGHNCERCGKCWLDYLRQPVKDGETE